MEQLSTEYIALSYDEVRLALFYNRATHGTNLAKEHRPDPHTVDKSAFSDAIIGQYIDRSAEIHREGTIRHTANLGRAAFAISFLQGVSLEHLQESILEDRQAKKKGVREFALGVAGEGARFAQQTVLGGTELHKKQIPVELHPSVDEFIDLDDTIKRLFHEGRVSSGKAQALLLLFGQGTSSATPADQNKARKVIRDEVKARLKTAIIHQPHHGEELVDKTFADGVMYIKSLLSTQFGSTNGMTALELQVDMQAHDSMTEHERQEHRNQIFGHIGYVVNKLYP